MDQDASAGMKTIERGLWLLVGACAVHAAEESLLDWPSWAHGVSGLQLTWSRFWVMNAGFLCLVGVAARLGATRPAIGLPCRA